MEIDQAVFCLEKACSGKTDIKYVFSKTIHAGEAASIVRSKAELWNEAPQILYKKQCK